jgi:hypothetical protein
LAQTLLLLLLPPRMMGRLGRQDLLDDVLLLRVRERLKRKARARYRGIALGRMR